MHRILLTYILAICILVPVSGISGQDSVLISKNFEFQDGIYLSFASFQANKPDILWESVDATIYTNPQTHLTKIAEVWRLESNEFVEQLNPENFWGICRNGIPSILLSKDAVQKELATFAALRLRGKICYFAWPDSEVRNITMSAYNPRTGRPFRTGVVKREVDVLREFILHFETGEIRAFTLNNFIDWIPDDPGLKKSVLELDESEVEEKLFRCLLIYVDRNAVYTLKS
ncbi:MAG: hypothetical protein GYB31_17915 [Bacteroidetes bacterium]|nr:hypothetical protein [Bacteroidota bacterium]